MAKIQKPSRILWLKKKADPQLHQNMWGCCFNIACFRKPIFLRMYQICAILTWPAPCVEDSSLRAGRTIQPPPPPLAIFSPLPISPLISRFQHRPPLQMYLVHIIEKRKYTTRKKKKKNGKQKNALKNTKKCIRFWKSENKKYKKNPQKQKNIRSQKILLLHNMSKES